MRKIFIIPRRGQRVIKTLRVNFSKNLKIEKNALNHNKFFPTERVCHIMDPLDFQLVCKNWGLYWIVYLFWPSKLNIGINYNANKLNGRNHISHNYIKKKETLNKQNGYSTNNGLCPLFSPELTFDKGSFSSFLHKLLSVWKIAGL